MIQDIDKVFNNQFKADMSPKAGDYLFVFESAERGPGVGAGAGPDRICISEDADGRISVPRFGDFPEIAPEDCTYLFSIDDDDFYLLKDGRAVECAMDFQFTIRRALRTAHPKELLFAATVASHLNTWYRSNRFCGRCGAETVHDRKQRMLRCPECGNMIFPRINPAVSVAVLNGDKLLVSQYAGNTDAKRYALIAGFVEIGETMEECVAREVMEEVGLKVKNIRYYKSQPWGIAGNLQVGFFAEVDGPADIVLDEEELSAAFFISREELEPINDRPALTQEMIELFRVGGDAEYR